MKKSVLIKKCFSFHSNEGREIVKTKRFSPNSNVLQVLFPHITHAGLLVVSGNWCSVSDLKK